MVRPRPFHFRALLRALLRECSYLPDPFVRPWYKEWIINRYRVYCPRRPRGDEFEHASKQKEVAASRIRSLYHEARNELKRLAAANVGHEDPLLKVLSRAYGRTGRRRHDLLAPIVVADVPTSADAVRELSLERSARADEGNDPVEPPKLSAALRSLIRAQNVQPSPGVSRSRNVKPAPKVPIEDAWSRPLPKKRAKNIISRWYHDVLEKVLPPLPRDEWERLRDLVTGKLKWDPPPLRRPRGRSRIEGLDGREYEFLNVSVGPEGAHKLTRRYMRRVWSRIFVQCPVMEMVPGSGEWKIEWGQVDKGLRAEIFEGDEDAENTAWWLFSGTAAVDQVPGKSTAARSDVATKRQRPIQQGSERLHIEDRGIKPTNAG